jgi:hypothetical protein
VLRRRFRSERKPRDQFSVASFQFLICNNAINCAISGGFSR